MRARALPTIFGLVLAALLPRLAEAQSEGQSGSKEVLPTGDGELLRLQPIQVVLRYWIEVLDESGRSRRAKINERFRGKERVRLHVVSDRDGAVQLGLLEQGVLRPLFPNPARGLNDNRLKAGVERAIPDDRLSFNFAGGPGTETLVLAFASNPQQLDRLSIAKIRTRLDTLNGGAKDLGVADNPSEGSVMGSSSDVLLGKIELRHD